MSEKVISTHIIHVDQPVKIETNSTGGLVVVMQRMPVKFEQVFDPENFTYTMKATWGKAT